MRATGPLSRARDPHDARRGAAPARPPDADRGPRARRAWAASAGSRSVSPASRALVALELAAGARLDDARRCSQPCSPSRWRSRWSPGLVFGLVPALVVLRGNTWSLLKDDSTRGSAGRSTGAHAVDARGRGDGARARAARRRAACCSRASSRLQNVDPGFATDHVLTAQMSLPPARYPDAAARRAFWTRLLEKARALPGVTVGRPDDATCPFNGNVWSGSYSIVGYTPGPSERAPHGRQEVVGGDYFAAMQIPLVAGRFFTDGDTADSPRRGRRSTSILANKYFAKRSALGQQIQARRPDSPPFTIVGVVGTINSIDLGQPVTKERIYLPGRRSSPPAAMALVAQDRARSADARRSGAGRGAVDRSGAADRRRADDGPMGLAVARAAADAGDAPGALRRAWRSSCRRSASTACSRSASRSACREFGIRQALGADRTVDPDAGAQTGSDDRRHRHRARSRRVGRRLAVHADAAVRRRRYDPAVFAGVTRCCSSSPSPPATCPPGARRASIRWSRCGTRDQIRK